MSHCYTPVFDLYGKRYFKSGFARSKKALKDTDLSEIKYLCSDWLKRLPPSQMIYCTRNNWLEAFHKVSSYPRANSEICFRLFRKKSNSEKLYRESQSEFIKT